MAKEPTFRFCKTCGKKFKIRPNNARSGYAIYCSHKCHGKDRSNKETRVCLVCGTEFKITPAWIRKGGGKYCSFKCKIESQSGSNARTWQGGISFLPYCEKFNREFKERVRAWFDYACVECGAIQKERGLHVHHVNYNKNTCCDGTIPMFVPLCDSCHSKSNFNREYWKQHFTDMINTYYNGKSYFTKEEYLMYKGES